MAFKVPSVLLRIAAILSLVVLAVASNNSTLANSTIGNSNVSAAYAQDPYLKFRPAFARSLPVQILLTGVVLTLVVVLFIHLVFTAQYHWPLAPVNYVLQISGVSTLLISLVATLHVVLSATQNESQHWPYMLSYIAVDVPPLDNSTTGWSIAEKATWSVMTASTSGLIQITHIQFLTLLYPSRMEGRLIFALLGPLAILAAIMQLIPITRLYPPLIIWGFLVKREDAWRTDGGTAAFGCGAVALALVSTALNFLYVPREEEYMWLPGLMWAVVLWQSFLGWWWWVGAGAESSFDKEEIARLARHEAKRAARKKEARERRRETKARAKVVWNGVAGALTSRQKPALRPPSTEPSEAPVIDSPTPASTSSVSMSSLTSSTTATSRLPRLLPSFMHQWYSSIRHEHVVAVRRQTVERVERIRELERSDTARSGWGLGSFAWRIDRRKGKPEEEEDEEYESGIRTTNTAAPAVPPTVAKPQGMWLWGPLSQWRLKDSTVY
ncbi:hypothetical protein C8F04DRAFT_1115000 [Mycena alexandri]|uniref:Uncharacterized protein n=1 Tax=Mycena alexandri TaxID=1745969 RepID=A0AAD6WZ80_9AGAR|nr:hypothetical protein C8F04DRAFT_1115000 [Mycena alexandri]